MSFSCDHGVEGEAATDHHAYAHSNVSLLLQVKSNRHSILPDSDSTQVPQHAHHSLADKTDASPSTQELRCRSVGPLHRPAPIHWETSQPFPALFCFLRACTKSFFQFYSWTTRSWPRGMSFSSPKTLSASACVNVRFGYCCTSLNPRCDIAGNSFSTASQTVSKVSAEDISSSSLPPSGNRKSSEPLRFPDC